MRKHLLKLALAANLVVAVSLPQLRAQQQADPTGATLPIAEGRARITVPGNNGSAFVELDSWVYPAMLRLAALGFVRSEFSDMRPWTRIECTIMLREAAGILDVDSTGSSSEAQRLYTMLKEEFQDEFNSLDGDGNPLSWQLESLYSKLTGITGQPLNDSYHFGQTIINNDGRRYQEGFNSYAGYSAHATAGPVVIYSRGEYQHAPTARGYTLPARQAIAAPIEIRCNHPRPSTQPTSFACLIPTLP
jgi:hypothetical protein